MARTIEAYFTCISPFAYLGHHELYEIAARHSAQVVLKPVKLMGLWEHSGAVPLPQRPKARVEYRAIELQRWRRKRNIPLNLAPAHFPTNPALADCCVIVLTEDCHGNAHEAAGRFMGACWSQDRDLADEATITQILRDLGQDATAVIEKAKSEAIQAQYAANTDEAVKRGAIGSPAYYVDGEQFWGQDRLELLDDMLSSGRAPYKAS
jgi:2-hydroxychromene-2-carboxylate isomerase